MPNVNQVRFIAQYDKAVAKVAKQLAADGLDHYLGGGSTWYNNVGLHGAAKAIATIGDLDFGNVKADLERKMFAEFEAAKERHYAEEDARRAARLSKADPFNPSNDQNVQYTDWDFRG